MWLDNHCPFSNLAASIGQTCVQKAVFGNANLYLTQYVKDGRYATEIVVFLLVDQMYMNNLRHNSFSIFFVANILNNNYME